MRSPFQVTYDDLISSTERSLSWMQKMYPVMVTAGKISDWTATHNIETEKAKLKLLKKFKRDPQTNLFDTFQGLPNGRITANKRRSGAATGKD